MSYPFLQIPKLNSLTLSPENIQIITYDDWKDGLSDLEGMVKRDYFAELLPYMGKELAPFRKQLSIGGVQYLCAVYPEENLIRLASPHLAMETFLLNEAKHLMVQLDCPEVKSFIEHVELMAILEPPVFPSDLELLANYHELPHLVNGHEVEIEEVKNQLVKELKRYRTSLFEKLTDRGLGLTAEYALFRVHLLKFLAILPSLDYDHQGVEVKRVLIEGLRRLLSDSKEARRKGKSGQFAPIPRFIELSIALKLPIIRRFPPAILARIVRYFVRYLAKRFIAGETIEKAHLSLKKLFASGRDATLDQLGELVVSEKEADHYRDEVLKLIRGFKQHVPVGSRNKAGINRANVSVKVSALCCDFNPAAFDYTYERVAPRLKEILSVAKEEQVFINVDAEHIHYRDLVFEIYRKVLLETPELRQYADTGIVVQAYLQDSYEHFLKILELAKERGVRMPVRLVKGAYWDAETIEAEAHHFTSFQFLNKEETDLMYRQIAVSMLHQDAHIQLVAASHNYLDHSFVESYRTKYCPQAPVIEHQCLDMTYEALSKGMAKMGWAVRNYVPVGSLLVGMAYLVRRIMENSSQVGVLTIMRSHHHDSAMKPASVIHREKIDSHQLKRDRTIVQIDSGFHNQTPMRLYRADERQLMLATLEQFSKEGLGKEYGQASGYSGDKRVIYSSSDKDLTVGSIHLANAEDAKKVMESAQQAYNNGSWAKARPVERASVLLRAAGLMAQKRMELASLIIYEAGKSLNEALGDVDEAIDFLNFYGREEIGQHRHNPQVLSKGVIVAITPWNFPLAIPCGMVAAPLVAGNAVILKSAGQTPLIAEELVQLLYAAGVPKDMLYHLPGPGSELGEVLLSHPHLAGAVFTGSKEVGQYVAQTAGNRLNHNALFDIKFPVSAITEMGGKNAIIVTGSADLDQAVSGIIYSAFGHAGQKCSAASRVLVDERIKDRLIERLKEAINDLPVGQAFCPSTYINPLITAREVERLKKSIAGACDEVKRTAGIVHLNRSEENFPGNCIGPVLIELPYKQALEAESYAVKELFGPVLHLVGYKTADEALALFNCTEYGLTGGIFSQSQDEIDWFTSAMEVGNIYVNRGITGARVGIEPFGGFKLSGTGPKAGGKSYLSSFHIDVSKNYEGHFIEGQRGSDYKFRCSLPSENNVAVRLHKVIHGLKLIDARFETIFTGVFGSEKAELRQLISWIEKNYLNYRQSPTPNVAIPGQDSFNDHHLRGECVLMVSVNRLPEFSSFLRFVFALLAGSGMTVLVRNDVSFKWWTRIASIFWESGIDKNNFDLFFCTEPLLVQALKTPYLSSIIVDGDENYIEEVLKVTFENEGKNKRMTHIYCHLDRPQAGDFPRYARESVWERSFAVNKMRHGAPLEIEE